MAFTVCVVKMNGGELHHRVCFIDVDMLSQKLVGNVLISLWAVR